MRQGLYMNEDWSTSCFEFEDLRRFSDISYDEMPYRDFEAGDNKSPKS